MKTIKAEEPKDAAKQKQGAAAGCVSVVFGIILIGIIAYSFYVAFTI